MITILWKSFVKILRAAKNFENSEAFEKGEQGWGRKKKALRLWKLSELSNWGFLRIYIKLKLKEFFSKARKVERNAQNSNFFVKSLIGLKNSLKKVSLQFFW